MESLLVDLHSNAAGFGSVFKTHTSRYKNHATAKNHCSHNVVLPSI